MKYCREQIKSNTDEKVDNGQSRERCKYELCKIFMRLLFTVLIVAISAILAFFNLRNVLNCSIFQQLKNNLDFIGEFLNRYPWLSVIFVLVCIAVKLNQNFIITTPTITFLGVEFQFRNSEAAVKAEVKNTLSSKRSIFVTWDDYDNYFDVINSCYEIYTFCRKQLLRFETFNETKSQCYKNLEGIMSCIGVFLTKYQSDYRRYYSKKIEDEGSGFQHFMCIQKDYDKYIYIKEDLHDLNESMKPYADYFGIDIEKWKNQIDANKTEKGVASI